MTIAVFRFTSTEFGFALVAVQRGSRSSNNKFSARHDQRSCRNKYETELIKDAVVTGGAKLHCKSRRCTGRQCWDSHQPSTSVRCRGGGSSPFVLSDEKPELPDELQNLQASPLRDILCLSNGHGEDAIAVAILEELKMLAAEKNHDIRIEALPLVGLGTAYTQAQIATVGPVKTMPSGGFIYMDILQLLGDVSAGLLSLTIDQWRAITRWVDEKPDGFIIAVGDVFPLALAWLAARRSRRKHTKSFIEYAFVGTAKSEFYLQKAPNSHNGLLASRLDLESLLGGVYLPWERGMMTDPMCRLVAPRDNLTAESLSSQLPESARHKVQGLGNPMMDGLKPSGALNFLEQYRPGLLVALLPGSRPPEVYGNWSLILEAATQVSMALHPSPVIFLTPTIPSLDPKLFCAALTATGWLPQHWIVPLDSREFEGVSTLESENGAKEALLADNPLQLRVFKKENGVLLLARGGFRDIVHWAKAGIAMAGTGTEQLVGLGKPVFTLAGSGPQFTHTFAEAQSRLLGPSVFLCKDNISLAAEFLNVIYDEELLCQLAENGIKRMGEPGAGRRIAEHIISIVQQGS